MARLHPQLKLVWNVPVQKSQVESSNPVEMPVAKALVSGDETSETRTTERVETAEKKTGWFS